MNRRLLLYTYIHFFFSRIGYPISLYPENGEDFYERDDPFVNNRWVLCRIVDGNRISSKETDTHVAGETRETSLESRWTRDGIKRSGVWDYQICVLECVWSSFPCVRGKGGTGKISGGRKYEGRPRKKTTRDPSFKTSLLTLFLCSWDLPTPHSLPSFPVKDPLFVTVRETERKLSPVFPGFSLQKSVRCKKVPIQYFDLKSYRSSRKREQQGEDNLGTTRDEKKKTEVEEIRSSEIGTERKIEGKMDE